MGYTVCTGHLVNLDLIINYIFKINEKFGRLDVIINNAGIIGNEGKLCDIPIEAYHRVIGVNLHGAWYTLK